MDTAISQAILDHYQKLGAVTSIETITGGLLNATYLVRTDQAPYILQAVSPVFSVAINFDAEACCAHLEQKSLLCPRILRTDRGELFIEYESRIYRALRYIDGQSFASLSSPAMAYEAGRVLGEFHRAMMDFNYEYQSKRQHGGNYSFHMQNLVTALNSHGGHDYFAKASHLASIILEKLGGLTAGLTTTLRPAHGDPKISNILFDDKGRGMCLVDFDTLGRTGWSLELADAMRSWGNQNPEDVPDAFVNLEICEAAIKAYATIMKGRFTLEEIDEFVAHCQAITLCLSSRYCADMLNESYFAYDHKRFERAAQHHLLRTESMLNLSQDFSKKSSKLREIALAEFKYSASH